MDRGWLSLSEYAVKYKVSISTLRRRIKSGKLETKVVQNKYFLKNIEMAVQESPTTKTFHQPSPVSSKSPYLYEGPSTSEPLLHGESDVQSPRDIKLEDSSTGATSSALKSHSSISNLGAAQPDGAPATYQGASSLTREDLEEVSVQTVLAMTERIDAVGIEIRQELLKEIQAHYAKQKAVLEDLYIKMMSEKEKEVQTLRSEISSLQTLVKILDESEGARVGTRSAPTVLDWND